jgi:hypothetical protein
MPSIDVLDEALQVRIVSMSAYPTLGMLSCTHTKWRMFAERELRARNIVMRHVLERRTKRTPHFLFTAFIPDRSEQWQANLYSCLERIRNPWRRTTPQILRQLYHAIEPMEADTMWWAVVFVLIVRRFIAQTYKARNEIDGARIVPELKTLANHAAGLVVDTRLDPISVENPRGVTGLRFFQICFETLTESEDTERWTYVEDLDLKQTFQWFIGMPVFITMGFMLAFVEETNTYEWQNLDSDDKILLLSATDAVIDSMKRLGL